MLGRQKSDVCLRDANIETGGEGEGGWKKCITKWFITTECGIITHVKGVGQRSVVESHGCSQGSPISSRRKHR